MRILGWCVGMLFGLGQPPASLTKPAAKTPPVMLSALLPTPVAEFVLRAGTDCPLDAIADHELVELLSPDPDAGIVLDILRPMSHIEVFGGVTFRVDEASPEGALTETLLVTGSMVVLNDGRELPFGIKLLLDDVVLNGLVFNAGNAPVIVQTYDQEFPLESGEVLEAHCASSCSVTCGTGSYSCCNIVSGPCAICGCIPNSQEPPTQGCAAGGKYSTQCSIVAQ